MFLHQFARDVGEFALLQLRLPENRIRVAEAVLDPAVFLHMIQVDETTRVSISVCGSKNASASQRKCLLRRQIIVVFGIQYTIGKGLTRTNAEQVAAESCAVGVDVVESRTFLLRNTSTHRTHRQAHSLV